MKPMAATELQIQKEVREIVFLLMKRPITEEIALRVEAIEGFEHLEIVDGEWVGFDKDETVGGEEHGYIEFKILLQLSNHVEQHRLGRVYPGDTTFVLDGQPADIGLQRRPDVAFVAAQNVRPSKGYYYGVPDLAVEIISPSERPAEIRKKLRQYLTHGVQQVWQVFPDASEIIVNFPDSTSKTYRLGDLLPGGDLLPDFSLDVAAIFDVR
jgi:Uma2 family endonuclease